MVLYQQQIVSEAIIKIFLILYNVLSYIGNIVCSYYRVILCGEIKQTFNNLNNIQQ